MKIRFLFALSLLATGLVASALLLSREGSESDPVQTAYNAGDLEGAITAATNAVNSDPSNLNALLALATSYAMRGSVGFAEAADGSKAIEFADKALALAPTNSEAHRIKGYALEIQERYDEAHKSYDEAIKHDPKNFQALSNKGHAYDLQGDREKAADFYKRSLAVNPHGEHALLNAARLYARTGQPADARAAAQTLVDTSANVRFRTEGYQLLAELYRGEDNYVAAKNAIQSALELDEKMPQAWVTRGRIELGLYLQQPLSEEQLETEVSRCAEKALAIHPTQASAYTLLRDLYTVVDDQEKSELYKQRALEAIDQDITLGEQERQELRDYLTASVELLGEESHIFEDEGPEETLISGLPQEVKDAEQAAESQ